MIARTQHLSHVAMSVPEGTLTDDYRNQLLEFYGELLGWREIEALRLADRLTIAVGRNCYVNLRERADGIGARDYEHFGITVRSAEEFDLLWDELRAKHPEVALEGEPQSVGGVRTFRMRYLLPVGGRDPVLPASP